MQKKIEVLSMMRFNQNQTTKTMFDTNMENFNKN